MNILTSILIIALITRPLICSPAFPQTDLLYTAILFVFLVCWILFKGLRLPPWKNMGLALMLFIASLLISCICSKDKLLSLQASMPYISGVLMFLTCRSLSCEEARKIFTALTVAAGLVIALAAYQYFWGFQNLAAYMAQKHITEAYLIDYVHQGRVYYPFITPNALGGFLIMLVPVLISHPKGFWIVPGLLFILFTTKSIGAALALLLALVIYFHLKDRLARQSILLLSAGLLCAAGIIWLRMQTPVVDFHPLFSSEMRLHYWQETLELITTHFWTGTGPGLFDTTASRYSHNAFLQIWAETGIGGILTFVFLVTSIFRAALEKIKTMPEKTTSIGLFAAACAFLIHNLTDFTFFLPELSLIWWAILGLLTRKTQDASC